VLASNCGIVVSSIVTAIGGEPIQEYFNVGTVSLIGCRSAVPCAVIVRMRRWITCSFYDGIRRTMNNEGK
jgi:hypothetical protein